MLRHSENLTIRLVHSGDTEDTLELSEKDVETTDELFGLVAGLTVRASFRLEPLDGTVFAFLTLRSVE